VMRVGRRHLVLYVADATGHGVSSAMMSVLFHRRLAMTDPSGRPLPPGIALERVNRALCEDRAAPGVFLTAAYCLIDLETGRAEVAGAGHPPVLLRSASGEVRRVRRTGPALGLVRDAEYESVRLELGRGDRLLLFTDGLVQGRREEETWPLFHEALDGADAGGNALLEAVVERVGGNGAGDPEDRDDVTVLLLEALPGPSRFDNRAGAAARTTSASRPRGRQVLWYGEAGERCFLEVRGRGTWAEADAFHETARGVLETGRPLAIVLARCDHLDSTFLGTIHELVDAAEGEEGSSLDVVGVPEPIRREFEELGMTRVLEHVHSGSEALPPDMQPLSRGSADGPDSQLRVLRAHEALAALSARNQEKFLAVVDAVRSQLGE